MEYKSVSEMPDVILICSKHKRFTYRGKTAITECPDCEEVKKHE